MVSLPGYDAWAVGGRYRAEPVLLTCPTCGEQTHATAETEYGVTIWLPEECPTCGNAWPDDTRWEDDEAPEPDYDRWRDET